MRTELDTSWVQDAKHIIETGERDIQQADISVAHAENKLDDVKRRYYEALQDIFKQAQVADPKLSNRKIADLIDRSHSWVNDIIKWKRHPSTLPFEDAQEAKRKRTARAKLLAEAGEPVEAPPLQPEKPRKSAAAVMQQQLEEMGQLRLDGGHSDYVPGQGDATELAVNAQGICRQFTRWMERITQEQMLLVHGSHVASRRTLLERFATELEKSSAAADHALGEVRAALKATPHAPDFVEVEKETATA